MPPTCCRRRRRNTTLALVLVVAATTTTLASAFVPPATAPRPAHHPQQRRAAAVHMMAAKGSSSSTKPTKKGSFLGRALRITLGTFAAAVGLTVAPLPRETVEGILADPEASMEQLATMDVGATLRDTATNLWQGLEDGLESFSVSNAEAGLADVAATTSAFFSNLQTSLPNVGGSFQEFTGLLKAGDLVQALTDAGAEANVAVQAQSAEWLAAVDSRVEETAQSLGELLSGGGLPAGLASQDVVRHVATFLKQAAINPEMRMQTEETLAAILVSGLGLAAAKTLFFSKPSAGALMDSPPLVYDPALIDAYYQARPGAVLGRLLSGLHSASGYLSGLLMDYVLGTKEQNAAKRAKQLVPLITELGPVFIKVAQLISVRPDIVGPVYLKELQQLQDQVKAFSSTEAMALVAKNLPKGTRLEDVYKNPKEAFKQPVAAASLGQVYKAELLDGTEVAVKVQRPNMLESITLDLYTVRLLCNVGKSIPKIKQSCESFIEVLNNWGGRFTQEIDYVQEAANTRNFAKAMSTSPVVKDAIVVPTVFADISTREILVTEWIEGRKINSFDKSDPADRKKLEAILGVMLNSYLVQLLETGILHADPHAGNFLVTPDGKLAILDHGLVTEIDADRRLALVEYVAHLTAQDWEATVVDLVRLGFIPQEIADDKKKLGIVAPILGSVLEQLSNGGGAKAVNVDEIGDQVESLAEQYPLTIPPWFGLIVRAFSAIEGLGLGLDSGYSIVNQCYPYLARRLLTDDSPRIRAALKSFLYGSEQQLKVERVNEMVEGYRNFSMAFDDMAVTVGGAPRGGAGATMANGALVPAAGGSGGGRNNDYLVIDKSTMEVLQILFHKDGNLVQELVTDEMVRMADAAIKEVTGLVARRAKAPPVAFANLFRRQLGPLGNLAMLPFLPLMTVLSIFASLAERAETLSQLTDEDRESLKTLRLLLGVVGVQQQPPGNNAEGSSNANNNLFPFPFPPPPPFLLPGSSGRNNFPFPFPAPNAAMVQTAMDMSAGMRQVLPEIAPGMAGIGRRFLTQLTGRILNRLADELEGPGNRL